MKTTFHSSRLTACLHLFLFVIVSVSVLGELAYRIIKHIFGTVSIDQILFHINAPIDAVDASITLPILAGAAVYLVFVCLYAYVVFRVVIIKKPLTRYRTEKIYVIYKHLFSNETKVRTLTPPAHAGFLCYAVLCVSLFALSLHHIDRRYHIIDYLNQPTSDFIEKHYVIPKISFGQKRNLVLIVLESIEKGYNNELIFGRNLIRELDELALDNISFSGHVETCASEWTQSAHVNMLMGIPMLSITKNSSVLSDSFLGNAWAITDELNRQGYAIACFFGATGQFSDMEKLFRSHGVQMVEERDYFDAREKNPYLHYGTKWGYKDSYIYEKMYEEYARLRTENRPFCLIMRTVDTHFPGGFVENDRRIYGDTRDAVIESSRMCSDFVRSIQAFGDDTTIVVVGDHLWMDSPLDNFTNFTAQLKNREIYNVFINTVFSPDHVNTRRKFATFDLAPTILESMGATLEGHRFGLGTSLFSEEKTLCETYGTAFVNEEFQKHHPFYQKLF